MPSARRRIQRSDDSDSQVESEIEEQPTIKRPPGACVHCKSLKVRCELRPGEKTCKRCKDGGFECLPRTRKKRKAAPTHEDLEDRSHNQDRQIHELLIQLDKIRTDRKIADWLSRGNVGYTHALDKDDKSAVCAKQRLRWINTGATPVDASISYFSLGQPSMMLEPPDIVQHCSLFPEEILWLFEMYFEKINPFFSLLDDQLHSAAKLIWTSPFLFTIICSTASKFYSARPDLYEVCTQFAQDAAGKALTQGTKSLETVQAFLILGVYPIPRRRWVQDRSWEYMGLAIRMALELGLQTPPSASIPKREALNRLRTWLNLVCVDASHSIQFGRIPMIELLDDYLARHCDEWYITELNSPFDVHLTAYVKLLTLMAKWKCQLTAATAVPGFDVVQAAIETQSLLQKELNVWVARYNEELVYRPLLICSYRGTTTQMITAYLRLVVLASAFQHADKSQLTSESPILKLSVDAALTVMQITAERLFPTGHLRYAMDANFLYVSFAAAYALNLLRRRFLHLLNDNVVDDILSSVRRLIDVLKSKKVVLHGRHTPVLYAQFLETLMDKHSVHLARRSSTSSRSDESYGQYDNAGFPDMYSWPDVGNGFVGSTPSYPVEQEMDLSLIHFVKTVTQNHYPTQPDDGNYWQMQYSQWDSDNWN